MEKWTPQDDQLLNLIKWWKEGNEQRRKEIEAEIRLLDEDGLLSEDLMSPGSLLRVAVKNNALAYTLQQWPLK